MDKADLYKNSTGLLTFTGSRGLKDIINDINQNPNDAALWVEKSNYHSMRGERKKEFEALKRAIQINPNDSSYWVMLGLLLNNIGQVEKAISMYKKAISIEEMPGYYAWLGEAYLKKKDIPNALENFYKLLEKSPGNTLAVQNIANIKHDLGKTEEGLALFTKALRSTKDNIFLWYAKSEFLMKLNRTQDALENINEAIKNNPESSSLYSYKSNYLIQLSKPNEALESIKTAITFEPNEAIAKELWARKIRIIISNQKPKDSLKAVKKVLKKFPTSIYFLSTIGKLYTDLGKYKKAIKHYQSALETGSGHRNAGVWSSMAICYFKAKNPYLASQCFQRASYLNLPGGSYENIFLFYTKHPNAPFFQMRIILDFMALDSYSKYSTLVNTTFQQCKNIYTFITFNLLQNNNNNYSLTNWNKWLGIINYMMGDVIVSYKILGKLNKGSRIDLMISYYIILNCLHFYEDEKKHITQAIQYIEQNKLKDRPLNSEENIIDIYYSGMIYLISNRPDIAINYFTSIQNNFLPAAYMAFFLYVQEKNELEIKSLKELILKKEDEAPEKGFINGMEVIYLNLELDDLRKPFAKYIHYKEVIHAVNTLRSYISKENLSMEWDIYDRPFWEYFKVADEEIERTRKKLEYTVLLKDWESRLRDFKYSEEERELASLKNSFISRELKIRLAYENLSQHQDSDRLEEFIGQYIREFDLGYKIYSEFINYFYFKGKINEYQKLLLQFYSIELKMLMGASKKIHIAGMKDAIKKVVDEGLAIATGIIIGNTIPGLTSSGSILVGTLSAIMFSYSKGALGDLYVLFMNSRKENLIRSYIAFKGDFENFIILEQERLGSKFFKKYPIKELQ